MQSHLASTFAEEQKYRILPLPLQKQTTSFSTNVGCLVSKPSLRPSVGGPCSFQTSQCIVLFSLQQGSTRTSPRHMGHFPEDREYSHMCFFKKSFSVTKRLIFFQDCSTVLVQSCPIQSKNTFGKHLEFFQYPVMVIFLPYFLIKITVGIKPLCDFTFKAGPKMKCPSSWPLHFDEFPFFFKPLQLVWNQSQNVLKFDQYLPECQNDQY